jgi:hypothetical protein
MTKCLTVKQAAEYIHARVGLTMRATCRILREAASVCAVGAFLKKVLK